MSLSAARKFGNSAASNFENRTQKILGRNLLMEKLPRDGLTSPKFFLAFLILREGS